jgi:hypothetical protein
MQILDYGTGHLMAFAVAAALRRQHMEGGSWHVRISLAQTGHWLRSLGRVDNGFAVKVPQREPYIESGPSGVWRTRCFAPQRGAVGHAGEVGARFGATRYPCAGLALRPSPKILRTHHESAGLCPRCLIDFGLHGTC